MTEEIIEQKNVFTFIRRPRRGSSEGAQLLENFDGVPSPNDDVLFYKLLRSPSDSPPAGRDLGDRVKVLGASGYQPELNEIARRVLEMARQPPQIVPTEPSITSIESTTTGEESTARKEWGQYLNLIELGGGIGQTLEYLRDGGFCFRGLVIPEALEFPVDGQIPSFGVFLRGNFRPESDRGPEESVPIVRGPEESMLIVRIPYLGLEGISLPEPQDGLGPQESWSLSKFISQVVTGLEENPLEDDGLSVHQAIFVVLNNAVILVSKSKEDKGARMVIPKQDRVGVFHVLVHMISETLRGGDRSILAVLESQATLIELQSLLPDEGSSREMAGKILGRITGIKALVAEQTAILEDLKDIFGRAVPDFKQPSIHSNKYTKNMMYIPVLSGPAGRTGGPSKSTRGPAERTRGQMSYVAATLEAVIEERRQFSKTLQKTKATMATNGQAQELKNELSELAQAAQEQKAQAEALQEEIEVQGKTLSAFTVVNVLFLPAGDGNARNGSIGTSIGLFWAVTAPCTFSIVVVALYFVLQSQYELRQFRRLFVDVLKLKGWKWPITKADAASQKNYLRKLRKYKVLVDPVDSEAESYYLMEPEIASDAGGDELQVRVENTGYPGEFRFDEEHGRLFYDGVDEYDYMYHLHVDILSVPPRGTEPPLIWKRSRMLMEEEPYRFKSAFRTAQEGSKKLLSWGYYERKGCRKPRWDTKRGVSLAKFFEVQDHKLSVRSLEPPATAPGTTPANNGARNDTRNGAHGGTPDDTRDDTRDGTRDDTRDDSRDDTRDYSRDDTRDGAPDDTHGGRDGAPGGTTDGTSDDTHDGAPNGTPDDAPDGAPDGTSGGTPGGACGGAPGDTPDGAGDGAPGDTPGDTRDGAPLGPGPDLFYRLELILVVTKTL